MSSFIGVEPARSTGSPENHKIFRVVAPVSRTIGENGIVACFRFFLKAKSYALTFVFASRAKRKCFLGTHKIE